MMRELPVGVVNPNKIRVAQEFVERVKQSRALREQGRVADAIECEESADILLSSWFWFWFWGHEWNERMRRFKNGEGDEVLPSEIYWSSNKLGEYPMAYDCIRFGF